MSVTCTGKLLIGDLLEVKSPKSDNYGITEYNKTGGIPVLPGTYLYSTFDTTDQDNDTIRHYVIYHSSISDIKSQIEGKQLELLYPRDGILCSHLEEEIPDDLINVCYVYDNTYPDKVIEFRTEPEYLGVGVIRNSNKDIIAIVLSGAIYE